MEHATDGDQDLLRAAAALTRDIGKPRPAIYWVDLILSVAIGYPALIVAARAQSTLLAVVAGVVAVFALYRAVTFIHELTHVRHTAVPGFRTAWNLLVGIPGLTPSFMYEGVHNMHHAKTRYGTSDDPEYLPLALMKPWALPAFVIASALAPIGLLFRFAILSPLSLVIPSLRNTVRERYSSLAINPSFRRRLPEGEFRTSWNRLEVVASLWAIAVIVMIAVGVIPMHALVVGLAVAAGVAVINQVRTLAAHLWESEGEPMSVTAQYLDSVNVPPPGTLPMLWAPVGLRYHALHHLLPGLPYHSLAEAHRRISSQLGDKSLYHKSNHASLSALLGRLMRRTVAVRR